jgi:protein subunit release factor B
MPATLSLPTLIVKGGRGYCIVERDVGTIRWMCIFSRSRHSSTRGAIFFQQSVS